MSSFRKVACQKMGWVDFGARYIWEVLVLSFIVYIISFIPGIHNPIHIVPTTSWFPLVVGARGVNSGMQVVLSEIPSSLQWNLSTTL